MTKSSPQAAMFLQRALCNEGLQVYPRRSYMLIASFKYCGDVGQHAESVLERHAHGVVPVQRRALAHSKWAEPASLLSAGNKFFLVGTL